MAAPAPEPSRCVRRNERNHTRLRHARAQARHAQRGITAGGVDQAGHGGGKWRTVRICDAFAVALFFVAMGGCSLGPLPLAQARQVSQSVVDRNGKLLRAYAMADGRWRLPVDAKVNVDPTYLKLLFAYEDKRFYSHAGIDPLALGPRRDPVGTRGHIVSGGSTITCSWRG